MDLDALGERGRSFWICVAHRCFKGKGSLNKKPAECPLAPGRSGTPEDVDSAMRETSCDFHEQLIKAQPNSMNVEERGSGPTLRRGFTTSVSSRSNTASFTDGSRSTSLPGTRGIVLLLLYLAVDIHDRRPLFIDQPEENWTRDGL